MRSIAIAAAICCLANSALAQKTNLYSGANSSVSIEVETDPFGLDCEFLAVSETGAIKFQVSSLGQSELIVVADEVVVSDERPDMLLFVGMHPIVIPEREIIVADGKTYGRLDLGAFDAIDSLEFVIKLSRADNVVIPNESGQSIMEVSLQDMMFAFPVMDKCITSIGVTK